MKMKMSCRERERAADADLQVLCSRSMFQMYRVFWCFYFTDRLYPLAICYGTSFKLSACVFLQVVDIRRDILYLYGTSLLVI